jgi:hypothetical protein
MSASADEATARGQIQLMFSSLLRAADDIVRSYEDVALQVLFSANGGAERVERSRAAALVAARAALWPTPACCLPATTGGRRLADQAL